MGALSGATAGTAPVDLESVLGVAPWVAGSSILTWLGQMWVQGRNRHDKIQSHQDDLTFLLLKGAREEMASARSEIEGLRDEVQSLRSLELHMFHFQQSLDHLEALLQAKTTESRTVAERNARAFLNRMRRLQEAKGTVRNEAQTLESTVNKIVRDTLGGEDGDNLG